MIKNFIATQFKKPSGLFGIFSSNIMIKGNKNKYERLIKDLDLQPGNKLLEIGFGPGVGINMIAKACTSCTIHGIDFSNLMYKRASKYNKEYINNGTMLLQYGDFIKTPIVGNEYDKIFCLNVVYFWNELQEPFQKVLTLLKTGGLFYIYMATREVLEKTPNDVFKKYSIEQVIEALKSVGFQDVEHYSEKGYYIKAKK
jgi:cyclopropane fatty-acyl-phospholipid synthase-like methyltransferase